jgi:DNA-binding transcriptional regulator GbsR (MarR family)
MTSPDSSALSDSPRNVPDTSPRHEEAVDRFVTFWGTMASSWGINRTMAQVYALLYCVEQPLNTDQIMERLQISRGSANMNLRSLVDWSLVEKTDVPDSRKDHYVAETDVWQVTARIIEERERQEVRPVRDQLEAVAEHLIPNDQALEDQPEADRALYQRIQNLIELIDVFERVTGALLPLVKNRNERLIRQLIAAVDTLGAPSAGEEAEVQNETCSE